MAVAFVISQVKMAPSMGARRSGSGTIPTGATGNAEPNARRILADDARSRSGLERARLAVALDGERERSRGRVGGDIGNEVVRLGGTESAGWPFGGEDDIAGNDAGHRRRAAGKDIRDGKVQVGSARNLLVGQRPRRAHDERRRDEDIGEEEIHRHAGYEGQGLRRARARREGAVGREHIGVRSILAVDADEAAERQRVDAVDRLAELLAPDAGRIADAELVDAHAAELRDDEVPEFMDENEHDQDDDE